LQNRPEPHAVGYVATTVAPLVVMSYLSEISATTSMTNVLSFLGVSHISHRVQKNKRWRQEWR
jgi:hypothetical protein